MDAILRDFALSLRAEDKRAKTISLYAKAAEWLARTQGIEDFRAV